MSEEGKAKSGSPRVRMAEVARVADVSLATVSRALREPQSVSDELRQRVEDACERLGYSPSPIAGSLSGRHTPLIGVVVSSITNSFFARTLESMSLILEPRGYQMMIGHHEYDNEREERIISAFNRWKPSALVVTGVHHTRTTTQMLAAAACPVIEMWDLDSRPIDSIIGFSNTEAGSMAAAHLLAAGYRRPAYVGAILDRDPRARARCDGFRATVRHSIDQDALEINVNARDLGEGCKALQQILAQHPEVDAIAFSGDMLAVGALFEAQRLGVRIPDDIALIGYGDLGISPHTNPALSTIRPPHNRIGTVVANHILKRLNDPESTGERVDLGAEVIERGSVISKTA